MKKIKLLSKVQLVVLKFLGFFIPYFKRMEKETTIHEISKLMNNNDQSYIASIASHGIGSAPIEIHQITYHVKLNGGGTLIIDLNYDYGKFSHDYSLMNSSKLTTSNLKEFYEAGAYYDKNIDSGKMLELFGQFK